MASGYYLHLVQDRAGNAVAGASVTIRIKSSGALATLYTDPGLTTPLPGGNPGVTSARGTLAFYANADEYTATSTYGGLTDILPSVWIGGTEYALANIVINSRLAPVPTATFKGRLSAGTGIPEDLNGTQATTLLDTFTATLKGLAPLSGAGTTTFLRADGTWAAPPGVGGGLLAANNLSDLTNAATARTNLGLGTYIISAFFTTVPTASEVLLLSVAGAAFTIPANFASALRSSVGTNPTATFNLDVQNNGTSIGTISVSTGGVVTATTVGGISKAIALGDVLKLVAPVTPDTTAASMAFSIIGVR